VGVTWLWFCRVSARKGMDVEGTVWMVWVARGGRLEPAPASVFILYGRGMRRQSVWWRSTRCEGVCVDSSEVGNARA
jgi:hypothetical protein